MSLVLVTPPAGAPNGPITLDQAKRQLRIDHDDDDDLINLLCDAAVAHLDPSGQGWLGAALLQQQWDLTLDRFPFQQFVDTFHSFPYHHHHRHLHGSDIMLPFPPLISVDSVMYYDADNILQTADPASYTASSVGSWRPAVLSPSPSGSGWPAAYFDRQDAVAVRFTCGHSSAALIPASIRQALLLLVGHLYENREAAGSSMSEIPLGVASLLGSVRIPSL